MFDLPLTLAIDLQQRKLAKRVNENVQVVVKIHENSIFRSQAYLLTNK